MKRILIILMLVYPLSVYGADYFDWSVRQDRDGKPAGVYTTTPFPVTEATTTYSITNDEGTKTYTLGEKRFVDNGIGGTCGNYDPSSKLCSGGSYTAYKTFSAAVAAFTSGNKTLLVRSGATYTITTGVSIPAGSGDTTRYHVIGYGQDRPVIDGSGVNYSAGLFNLGNYVTVQRLEFFNTKDEGIHSGSYCNLVDLLIHDICIGTADCDGGIFLAADDYNYISHSEVYRSYNHGYKVSDYSDYNIIEWSIARNIGYFGDTTDNCTNHCIAFDFVDHYETSYIGIGNVLRYSKAYDTYHYGLNAEGQRGQSIHHNEFYNNGRVYDVTINKPTQCGGTGCQDSGTSVCQSADDWICSVSEGAYAIQFKNPTLGTFYSNVVYDYRSNTNTLNEHGLFQLYGPNTLSTPDNILIYNNLFYQATDNMVEHLMQFSGNLQSGVTVSFYNNTLYGNTYGSPDALLDDGYSGTVNVKNNIFYQMGTGACASGTFTGGYNLFYYPNGGSKGGSSGTGDIDNQDPLFATPPSGSYTWGMGNLSASSPVIGQGTDLSATFTTDFNGTARGAAWDMGMYEYAAGGGSPSSGNRGFRFTGGVLR